VAITLSAIEIGIKEYSKKENRILDYLLVYRVQKERIQPINTAGLPDPAFKNRYPHTAATL